MSEASLQQHSSHLIFQQVSIRYDVPVLADVSFHVAKNQITAIVGPSGCGKSSLLMSVNQLAQAQGAQVRGSIAFEGYSLLDHTMPLLQLRRQIGFIFQRPNPFPTSIYKNLEIPLQEHGFCQSERAGRIETALRDVGLWQEVASRLTRPAQSLSGGQQQRLCIARALAIEPRILLLDEPCSALDPLAGAVVDELLSRLAQKMTLVIVTHNLQQAKKIAQQVVFIGVQDQIGRLIEAGPTMALFANPQQPLTREYLAPV